MYFQNHKVMPQSKDYVTFTTDAVIGHVDHFRLSHPLVYSSTLIVSISVISDKCLLFDEYKGIENYESAINKMSR